MSRKAKGQQVGVALFPFLAVLICTMGALIVLLVLLVQQARVDATAIAAAKSSATSGDDRRVRERLEDAQWQRELLEKSRAEKTEELSEARSRVAHLEEHTQRLAAQAKELLERAKAIDQGKKLREEDAAAARAEAAKLKAEIEKKKEELEKAKKKPQDGQEWYALIPYDGRAGTRRRPIYVECTEFGVVIQPEGILLRADDFNGPLGPGNPLDSALRAIREHWEKTAGSKAAQPYPLLVVRPSGVVAFGAAKAAISAWDDEWGYELISDDKHLDFGPPDPVLNASLSKSVAVSRQRQAAIVAMMPRRFQGEEPLRSFTPEPTIAAGGSRYIGGAGGGASGGSGLGSGSGSGPGGNGTAGGGTGSGTGGQPSGGGMARGGGGYGNGLGTGTGTTGGNGTTSGTGFGGATGGQVAGMNRGGTGGYRAGGYGTAGPGGVGGYGSASGTGATGNGIGAGSGVGGNGGGGTSGGGIPSVTGGLNGSNAGQTENLVGRNAASAIGGTGGGAGGDAFPGSTTNGGGTGPGGSSYGTGSGVGGSSQAGGGGQTGAGGQAGGGQFGGSSGGQSFAGSGSGGQTGSTMSNSSGGGGSSVGSAGGASSGGGSPFGGSSMSAGSSGGMGMPSLNFGGVKGGQSSAGGGQAGSGTPNSTAKRGKNWALPQTKQNQTGVTRHIRVSLQPDRVVMLPEAGDNRAPQVVKIAPELTPDDVTHFVSAVQNEVKGWGLAVADGYWKPTLQVEVAPGAERQYLNLETALHGSGIEIIRR